MPITRNPVTNKIIPKTFTLEDIEVADEEYAGYCIACGAYRECTEPDARRYKCDDCGLSQVYGASELVIMGLVT